jgi:hypothetical protein
VPLNVSVTVTPPLACSLGLTGLWSTMRLEHIRIDNFRGLSQVNMPFSRFGCLIGENNAGKSSVFQALNMFLRSGSATETYSLAAARPVWTWPYSATSSRTSSIAPPVRRACPGTTPADGIVPRNPGATCRINHISERPVPRCRRGVGCAQA